MYLTIFIVFLLTQQLQDTAIIFIFFLLKKYILTTFDTCVNKIYVIITVFVFNAMLHGYQTT